MGISRISVAVVENTLMQPTYSRTSHKPVHLQDGNYSNARWYKTTNCIVPAAPHKRGRYKTNWIPKVPQERGTGTTPICIPKRCNGSITTAINLTISTFSRLPHHPCHNHSHRGDHKHDNNPACGLKKWHSNFEWIHSTFTAQTNIFGLSVQELSYKTFRISCRK